MSDAPFAIVVMGVSGVGKTTVAEALAKRLGWDFADGDAFHPPGNVEKMRAGIPLTDADRRPWLTRIAGEIGRQREASKPIVIASSALKRAYRDILKDGRSEVRLVYLKGDRELILKRLQSRKGHYFPATLLDSQFAALEEPEASELALVVTADKDVDAIVDEIVARLGWHSH